MYISLILSLMKNEFNPPRRQMLRSTLGTGVAISLGTNGYAAAEPVLEWNAHIFSPDLKKYPVHPKAVCAPNMSVHPADQLAKYLQRLNKQGIDRAVIVHPEPYGDDHSLVLDCLQREPNRLRERSLFYPKDPQAPAKRGRP